MSRPKRKGRRILLSLLVFIMLVAGAGIWFILPTKDLDLRYHSIDVKEKILKMIETREPRITLTQEEVAQMSKKNLIKYMSTHDLGVDITGADFRMNGDRMTADVNGKWGAIPFGAELGFRLTAHGSLLNLEHTSTHIRGVGIPLSIFKLEPIEISMKDYLPDVITVREVDFLEEGMRLTFKIDWLSLPSLW